MGAGKSCVGMQLARRLGWSFVDTDDVLAARHGAVADQIRLEGEEVFRARETAVIETLCDGAHRVLATGGGAFASDRNRALLQGSYLTVHLQASLDTLRKRIGAAAGDRPLWGAGVAELYAARQPAYDQAAVRIVTDGRTPEQVVDLVMEAM